MGAIGGYFELELPQGEEFHKKAIRLNTGRNAFEYVLLAKKYQKVYLPYFTCDAMLEPIHKLNLNYVFYSIDKHFRPVFDFSKIENNSVFVYTNYFGICDKHVKEVSAKCKNLIIDNSQAFYSLPLHGVDTFYSPRKFFGVPDGAYLYTDTFLEDIIDRDYSFSRFEHLLGRFEKGPEEYFPAFQANDQKLSNQSIKHMSKLTQRLLSGINYTRIAEIRLKNFKYLKSHLNDINEIDLSYLSNYVPMVFPLLTNDAVAIKKNLIQKKIFVATYWPNVIQWCNVNQFEYKIANEIINLPLDQRYDENEMELIIANIKAV